MVFIIAVVLFTVYLYTLHPAVSVGDSGELITAAYTLGITHPPGYPLWTILGKIFTVIIPFGNIAYRVNLMSAFFGTLTCLIVYLITKDMRYEIRDKSKNPSPFSHLPSLICALALAFSSTFWSQAIISEVYTLNAFFVVLIIYLLLARYSLLAFFIYGLSLTNHYIMFLFGPVFVLYIIWKNPKVLNWKTFFSFFIFLLLGWVLYLYLPIRSAQKPPIDWGNPENFTNFSAHLGRFQYRGLELAKKVGFETKVLFMKNLAEQVLENFGLGFCLIAIAGLIKIIKKNIKFAILTCLIFLVNTFGLIFLLNFKFTPQDIDAFTPYYIPAWIMVSIWIGYEIFELGKIKLCLVPVLLILGFQVFSNIKRNNNRYNFVGYDYPVNILKSIAKNGILYLYDEVDETIFTISYLKNVVHKRPDITVIDSYNNIFSAKNLSEKDIKYYSAVNTEKIGKPLLLNGLIWTITNTKKYEFQFFYVQRLAKEYYEYREQEVVARYPYFYGKFLINNNQKKEGIIELKKALQSGKDLIWLNNNIGDILRQQKKFDDAFFALSHTISLDSSYSPAYYNLGLLYLEQQKENKAIECFQNAYQYDSTDKDSLGQLSKIYQNKGYKNYTAGKIENAISDYKKAIEYTPENADIYYNIAVIYSQIQNKKEAKNYFQKYLQLKPGGPNADTVRKWLANNISD
ncbi:MAG: DUF2723 domain-containing protein [Elusimicrobiota bacterium]